jgi:hypothetical protein
MCRCHYQGLAAKMQTYQLLHAVMAQQSTADSWRIYKSNMHKTVPFWFVII